MEDRTVPSTVVYSNTFNWNGVASVAETVTLDAPGHAGQYLWNFHVTNLSFTDGGGMSKFALPVEEPGMVFGLGSSVGWAGSVGTLLGDSSLVAWQGGAPLGIGQSADFWFTTVPTALALTNGILSNAGLTTLPAGFLAVPIQDPPAPLPVAPMPTIVLVSTLVDKADFDTERSSLREAIVWVNHQSLNMPGQPFKIRFTQAMTNDTITLVDEFGQLAIERNVNVFIDGRDRNITVTRGALEDDFRLIYGDVNSQIEIAELTLTNGGGVNFNGADDNGGAIQALGNLTLREGTIKDNKASNGAGVYAASLIAEGCYIQNNSAGRGGGIYITGNLTLRAIPTPDGLKGYVSNNKAVSSGAGIYALAGTVTIEDMTISRNEAGFPVNPGFGLGGGVFIGSQVTQANIRRSDIFSNRSDGRGGGIYVQGGTDGNGAAVTLEQCWLATNNARSGAGVAIMKGTLSAISTTITGNNAEGGLAGYGGGVYIGDRVTAATFSHSFIVGNTALTSGGGIWIDVPQAGINLSVTLDDTSILTNRAANQGGGIGVGSQATAGTLQLTLTGNSLISGNNVTDQGSVGGGLYLGYGTVTFDGVTFDTNIAGAALATGFYVKSEADVVLGAGGVTVNNDTWFIEP